MVRADRRRPSGPAGTAPAPAGPVPMAKEGADGSTGPAPPEAVASAPPAASRQRPNPLREANEQLLLSILLARDSDQRCQAALAQATRAAERDPLTGLPNRMLLMDRLHQAVAHSRRSGSRMAMLFLDLDNFKWINDTFGHGAGDRVLRSVAGRLTATVREEDTVSRHGGDEFLVLLPEINSPEEAAVVARKIVAALAAPGLVAGHEVAVEASIGISIFPDDGTDPDRLIDQADAAMYRSRHQGPGGIGWYGMATPASQAAARVPVAPGKRDARARDNAQLREANAQLVLAYIGLQKQQAASKAAQLRQDGILALVAHELRNPLTPIRIAASLLARPHSSAGIEAQEIIEQEVVHMMRLIDDLLDVERASTGKLRLERVRVDLAKVIEGAVGACRPVMDSRGQQLALEIAPGLPTLVGDPVRLGQVVRNLLDNASKYTPAGGRIGLSAMASGESVGIVVSDDGIGISAAALPSVFNPYVQDPEALGFDGRGLGIGLTVVRELVEAHGGTVTAHSEGAGTGSRFEVTLPLQPRPAPADRARSMVAG